MATRKAFLLVALAAAVILLGWLGVYLLSSSTSDEPKTPVEDPFGGIVATSTPTPVAGMITIKNADGTTVAVPDFTRGRTPLESNSDTYYDLVHEGPLFGDENYTFSVQYQSSNSHFLVSILKEPLGSSRTEAETFLRSTLVLPNDALCRLNLSVIVTTDVHPVYADKGDLGLSFCPGAVPLP